MSNEIEDIVIPILRNLQTDLSDLKSDIIMIKESVRRIDHRNASMDSHIAGFHSKLSWSTDEMDDMRGRLEALEDRINPKNKT